MPATVTRPAPNDTPIVTTAVWVPSMGTGADQFTVAEIDSHGVEIMRTVRRRVIALRVDEVPAAPVGTLILAPEALGETAQRWLVDEIGYVENDLVRVFVRPMKDNDYLASWGKS